MSPFFLALLPLTAAQFLARQDQGELQKLQDEVQQWKARYGNLMQLYSQVSDQQSLIEVRPYGEKIFMPGNVQHCRDDIASVSPQEATNPKSEPKMDYSNYSHSVGLYYNLIT